jgi:general secretion pathway protein G
MAKVSRCQAEIRSLEKNIISFNTDKGVFPPTGPLTERDPWGNRYQYVNIANDPALAREKSTGATYNTDFDIYSTGPDGNSAVDFNDPTSKDDIVRGGDGGRVEMRY